MWMMTDAGYYSATFKNGAMQIRTRRKEDIEALRAKYAPELGETIETFNADYPYRALCTPEQWGDICSRIAQAVSYDNFKDRIHEIEPERAEIYGKIWHVLLDLETAETNKGRRAYYAQKSSKFYAFELLEGDKVNGRIVSHVVQLNRRRTNVFFTDGSYTMYPNEELVDVAQ